MNIKVLKKNMRDYGMFIALIVIMLLFTVVSGGVFMTPRNLTNLLDQTGYVAVLAVGMTLILIIRHIDLSVGFVAGFLGAIAALLMRTSSIPLPLIILVTIALGALIGVYQGWLVAFMGLPSFVATLAGMFIFRGALLRITEATGTIIVEDSVFNALGNGFIPDIFNGNGFHLLTMVIGLVAIAALLFSEIRGRNQKKKYGFELDDMGMFLFKLFFISALILFFSWKLALYHGISWTVVVMFVIVAIFNVFMNNTPLGRHVYAIGGNPEAAELSGIKVRSVTYVVFILMSALASVAGILYASRMQSATTTAGTGFELDAIAASFIGGVSATGGIGKITNTIVGAIVITALSNGMNLIGIEISYQYIVRGLVLVLAVLFDVQSRRVRI